MIFDARPDSSPSPEEIALRAYEIWLREGQPEGRAYEHWLAAEQMLMIERQAGRSVATPMERSRKDRSRLAHAEVAPHHRRPAPPGP